MATLSRDEIFKLAALARLAISDDEATEFEGEINEILQFVEQLQSVDVSEFEPTSQVTGLTNVSRDDAVIDYGYTADDLLKNVPAVENHQIKVQRMVG
ncbi:MAG: glutamyl-tRNA amidotransferase subunit [Candidatus Saccharibacteria bacterium]|nr:glutamyl-tRNA amidotransferase subunit [Candidatus Saccharibacteria bacterium]